MAVPMAETPIESADGSFEFPLRFSKTSLSTVRDDNAFVSPLAIEAALQAFSWPTQNRSLDAIGKHLDATFPFSFFNYVIADANSIESFRSDLNKHTIAELRTEFQSHAFNDNNDERKNVVNQLLKHFSDRAMVPVAPSQKTLGQLIVDPMTLLTCSSLVFRPYRAQHWEQLWSLKFQSNNHLSIETEFSFTKGFFRVAFHDTFHKIEIPGQCFHGLQMNLIILLPRCSSDLVHLYANIEEYLSRPWSSAFLGVCLPHIAMDVDVNLIETLRKFDGLHNNRTFSNLAAARGLGRFVLDMSSEGVQQTAPCLHSVDLSPVTPWIFFANRPFLFLIMYGEQCLLIGQMLGPKLRQETNQRFTKHH